MVEDEIKRKHSENMLVMLYIAHVLPLACKSEELLGYIFFPEDHTERRARPRNFHANFTLDGWNDHIIKPARDAVLDYYKVCTPCLIFAVLALTALQSNTVFSLNQRYAEASDVEAYMRLNDLS